MWLTWSVQKMKFVVAACIGMTSILSLSGACISRGTTGARGGNGKHRLAACKCVGPTTLKDWGIV